MEHKTNRTDKNIIITLIIFTVLFVFFNSKCSPLYQFNEWGDPNIYFSMGKGALNGKIIYKDIFDHKGPLIFFLYAAGYLISNDSFTGIFLLEIIALFFNLLFAYKLSRLYLGKPFAFIISILYSLFIFNKTYLGGSAEEFISPIITASFYYFIVYYKYNRYLIEKEIRKIMLCQGIFFALVLLTKFNICCYWLPLIVAIGVRLLKERKYRTAFRYALCFIIGTIIVSIPFIAYFSINSAITDFYFAYIKFNSLYAEIDLDLFTLKKILVRFIRQISNDYISFPITLLGVTIVSFTKKYIKDVVYRMGVLFSFILSYFMVAIVPYLMTYALIIIYIYSLFGLIFITGIITKYWHIKLTKPIVITVSIIVLIGGIYQKQFFGVPYECLTHRKPCNYMQKQFAKIINKEDSPTLLDLGLDHGVFTKANIIPCYKYFFLPNIRYEIFPEIVDYQTNLILNKIPDFIVLGNTTPTREHFIKLLEEQKNYELVSTYEQNIVAFDSVVYLYKRKEE